MLQTPALQTPILRERRVAPAQREAREDNHTLEECKGKRNLCPHSPNLPQRLHMSDSISCCQFPICCHPVPHPYPYSQRIRIRICVDWEARPRRSWKTAAAPLLARRLTLGSEPGTTARSAVWRPSHGSRCTGQT
jgi:hypothetical protein